MKVLLVDPPSTERRPSCSRSASNTNFNVGTHVCHYCAPQLDAVLQESRLILLSSLNLD